MLQEKVKCTLLQNNNSEGISVVIMKELKDIKYIDITEEMVNRENNNLLEPRYVCEYIKAYDDGSVIKYDESNAKFDKNGLNDDEISSVKRIQKYFKWNIELVREINIPEGIRCPDIRNISSKEIEYWDIKGIYMSKSSRSKNNKISHAINEANGQAVNIILDLNRSGCNLSNKEALEQLNKAFNNRLYNSWLNMVMLIGKDNFIIVFKRK